MLLTNKFTPKMSYAMAIGLISSLGLIAVLLLPPLLALVVLIPYLLFLPGSALVFAFFPHFIQKSRMEMLILSIGLSFVVLVIEGIILNMVSPWGVSALSWMIFTGLFSFLIYGLGLLQGRQLFPLEIPQVNFSNQGMWQTIVPLFLLIPIMLIVLIAGIQFRTIRAAPLTQIWMLPDVHDNSIQLSIGIHNMEQRDTVYYLDVVLDDRVVETLDAISVSAGATSETAINLDGTANAQTITVTLYTDPNRETAYRTLSYTVGAQQATQ
jgi:uncharacterized membrane protein